MTLEKLRSELDEKETERSGTLRGCGKKYAKMISFYGRELVCTGQS